MVATKTTTSDEERIFNQMEILCQTGRGDSPEMEALEDLLARVREKKAGR